MTTIPILDAMTRTRRNDEDRKIRVVSGRRLMIGISDMPLGRGPNLISKFRSDARILQPGRDCAQTGLCMIQHLRDRHLPAVAYCVADGRATVIEPRGSSPQCRVYRRPFGARLVDVGRG